MNKRVLVVASSYKQFLYWCRKRGINPRKVRYIGHSNSMEGYNADNALVVFVEQWYAHQNLERIRWYVATRFPHIVEFFDNPDLPEVDRMIQAGDLT